MNDRDSFDRETADAAGIGRLLAVALDTEAVPAWRNCVSILEAAGHAVRVEPDLRSAGGRTAVAESEVAVLVVTDSRSQDRKILDLVSWLSEAVPVVMVGVVPGSASRSLLRAGAHLTVEDPAHRGELESAVARSLRLARSLRREARFDSAQTDLRRLIGVSNHVVRVHRTVSRVAASTAPVLLSGEVGTGKQIVARALHLGSRSRRRQGPFVRRPLGGLATGQIHDELYGTPARPGLLELAHQGTLFLDDITLMPKGDQAGLLELLEAGRKGTFRRADGRVVASDIRLIAGTTLELDEELARGHILEALHGRLMVSPIEIPPLRHRIEDIPVIADTLIDRYSARQGKAIVGLAPDAVGMLQAYAWPGNIREMEEHIERAVRRSSGPSLLSEDLAELRHMIAGKNHEAHTGTLDITLALDDALTLAEAGKRAKAAAEIEAIRRALKVTEGNITHAARRLRVSRIHLQKRMKLYGMRE